MDQLHHQHQQQLQQLHGQIHQLQQQLLQQQQQNPQNQTLQHQEEDDNDQGPQVVAQQEVVVEAPQGGLQQVDAEVGEQGPPPVDPPPVMSDELKKAIRAGDILKIISRLDAGESPNSVTSRGSAAISALRYGDLGAAKVFRRIMMETPSFTLLRGRVISST
jgi:TolA-binding protein